MAKRLTARERDDPSPRLLCRWFGHWYRKTGEDFRGNETRKCRLCGRRKRVLRT